jgi:alpha-tubulin suppressor-like RCC1 family protein
MRWLALGLLLAGTLRVGCDCGTPGPLGDAGTPDAFVADASAVPTALALGDTHGCRIAGGVLSCFGSDPSGALGVGDTQPRQAPAPVTAATAFVDVITTELSPQESTCALDALGDLYCWGDNTQGQLGQGDFAPHAPVPQRVSLPLKVQRLGAALFGTACVIVSDGTLWCWGANGEGQLGLGDFPPLADQSAPQQVSPFSDWVTVAVGQGHACGIRDGGLTFCWGRNNLGQLGLDAGAPGQLRAPQLVPGRFDQITVGQDATCALSGTRLFCWGALNEQLPAVYGPTELDAGIAWAAVSTNAFHTCGLDTQGQAYCWGRGIEGQLGQGDDQPRAAPARLSGSGFSRVRAGRFASCTQSAAGTFCTGDNGDFQLGLGDAGSRFYTLQPQP